jgi:type II secretory pathway component PulM
MATKSAKTSPAIPLPPQSSKTIEELAAEQGVQLPQNLDRLLGAGAQLWDNDAEFDQFLGWLNDANRKGSNRAGIAVPSMTANPRTRG